MKVIHIESGLGNQMLSYCEYLAMKKANPTDDIYIENIVYDIPEAAKVICQWNGYELDKVFNINVPNIKHIFSKEQWKEILEDINNSEYWNKNWNYPVHFTNAFRNQGIEIENMRGDFESPDWPIMVKPTNPSLKHKIKDYLNHNTPFLYLKRIINKINDNNYIPDFSKEAFISSEKNIFTGNKLVFMLKNSKIELIEDEIRKSFVFPEITDLKNKEALEYISEQNAVAIHARRGDMLGYNYAFYATGYFQRAVSYIREHTQSPVFFIFCDPKSVQWAKENAKTLGLNIRKDEIHFVDWNSGTDSFRDIQLMAECKHQVITNSSFGWWGAWLNTNPDKITCSPNRLINTTHYF